MMSLESATRGPQFFDITQVSDLSFFATVLSRSSMGHERMKKPSTSNGSPPKLGSVSRMQHMSVLGLYFATPLVDSPRKSRFLARTYLQTGIFSRSCGWFVTFAFLASETTDFDDVLFLGCDRWGVHFGACGVRPLAGPVVSLRLPFPPTSREMKVSKAVTSAGIYTCIHSGCGPSVVCDGRPAPVLSGRVTQSTCFDVTQEKRRCSPTALGGTGDVHGPK